MAMLLIELMYLESGRISKTMLTLDTFKGMDNMNRSDSLPDGYLRNAENVQFGLTGKAMLSPGVKAVYSGTDVHSLFGLSTNEKLFIDDGYLKQLNRDNSVITLGAIENNRTGYCKVGDRVFIGNGVKSYVVKAGVLSPLGFNNPNTLTLSALPNGGLYGGVYHVAITYIRGQEEHGASRTTSITVPENDGIVVELPPAPTGVTKFGVYVTAANGSNLYLYKEISSRESSVTIAQSINGVKLNTRFCHVPVFSNVLAAHNGRIYWADGDLLRWTEPLRYHLTKAANFAKFGGNIDMICALPGVLYIGANKTYQLTNIDGDGFMVRREIMDYGVVKGTLAYDDATKTAFWQSQKGFVSATAEGAQELVSNNVSLPSYSYGCGSIVETNGVRNYITVVQQGTDTSLMNDVFKVKEITRKGNAL